MSDRTTEFRVRAAKEIKAARSAKSELDRTTHRNLANAYKALAESEAWLAGRVKPVGQTFVQDKQDRK